MQLHTHTAGQDSRVQVYDLRKKAKIQTLDKHVNAVSSLAFSPCGNYVRSPSSLRHLRFLLHIPSILLAWDRIDRVSPGVAWGSGDDYVFRFISDSLSQGSMNDANSSPVLSFPHLLTPPPFLLQLLILRRRRQRRRRLHPVLLHRRTTTTTTTIFFFFFSGSLSH